MTDNIYIDPRIDRLAKTISDAILRAENEAIHSERLLRRGGPDLDARYHAGIIDASVAVLTALDPTVAWLTRIRATVAVDLGLHTALPTTAPGTWSEPTITEYVSGAPWGDDAVSGWEAAYTTPLPGGGRVEWVEAAFVSIIEDRDDEPVFITNAQTDLRVLDADDNEIAVDIIPSDPPTAEYHYIEAKAHSACERYVRSDLRNYPDVLDGAYAWATART